MLPSRIAAPTRVEVIDFTVDMVDQRVASARPRA